MYPVGRKVCSVVLAVTFWRAIHIYSAWKYGARVRPQRAVLGIKRILRIDRKMAMGYGSFLDCSRWWVVKSMVRFSP
jgi:hypothetical protein